MRVEPLVNLMELYAGERRGRDEGGAPRQLDGAVRR